jgi:hypothetical protein
MGDVLFNLRSALDNLVCGLVRKENAADTCRGRYFPIYANIDDYQKDDAKKLRGVPPDAAKEIERFQPFQRLDVAMMHPLHLLNDLCNRDKHRAAHLTVGYNINTTIVVHGLGGRRHVLRLPESLYPGDASAVTVDVPSSVPDNPRVEASGSFHIIFRNYAGPTRDRPVDEVLRACRDYVIDRVVPALKPFFKTP